MKTKLMANHENRAQSRLRSYKLSDLVEFAFALVILVIGALTMAFGILKFVAGTSLLFGNTDPAFQVLVGFVVVIIGSFLMQDGRTSPV